MNETEKAIRISAKLYEARHALFCIVGAEKYFALVERVRPQIERKMAEMPEPSVMSAGLEMAKAAAHEPPMETLLILATIVEMLEPSPNPE